MKDARIPHTFTHTHTHAHTHTLSAEMAANMTRFFERCAAAIFGYALYGGFDKPSNLVCNQKICSYNFDNTKGFPNNSVFV